MKKTFTKDETGEAIGWVEQIETESRGKPIRYSFGGVIVSRKEFLTGLRPVNGNNSFVVSAKEENKTTVHISVYG